MYILVIAFTLLVSGCASMVAEPKQELSFQTNPEGVAVTIFHNPPPPERQSDSRADGWTPPQKPHIAPAPKLLGTTPLKIALDRAVGQSIIFSKDGYKPLTMELSTRLHPAFWGNVMFGGLIGSAIDSATGAAWEYVPNQYFVTLIPLHATSIDQDTNQTQRDKAIVFMVRRYAGIMADVSRGSGEDWSALLGLLRISPGQDAEARTKIKAFATIYSDAATFATKVADFYYPPTTAAAPTQTAH